MSRIALLLVAIFLLSCGETKRSDKPDRFAALLSKFQNKIFDTLHVYSPEDLEGEFKGTPLDSADATLFPTEIAQQHFAEPPGIFAIYKFALDSSRTALIARTPSEYVPSSIKLFVLDRTKDTIMSIVELAESWGDAGDYMTKSSWLFKDQKRQLNSLIWLFEGHDNSVDNEADTTTQEWNTYFLLNLSRAKTDTISKDEKQLSSKFKHLLQ